MQITYNEAFIKYFIIYNAPNRLFKNKEERKNWSNEQIQEWFRRFWEGGFSQAISEGEVITADTARGQLDFSENDSRLKYFQDDSQHLLIRYRDMSFVTQLVQFTPDRAQVNQVWFVNSRDYNPLIICVNFPSEESKKRFIALAGESDKHGKKLLEQLVRNHMRQHGQSWY